MAPRLNNNFPNGTWRCCDSHIGIYIKSHQWPSHETTIVYLEGHDQETVNRCRAMMAQLISEEKSGGRDMLSTDEILGDRDKDLRRQAINNWRMCGAQGIGRAKTRGDGPGGGGVMNFGYSGNSERPAKTKYLPMSNEEFVFITGVGLQLIKEIQKHGVTFRVHIPPSHQFSSTPKPITAPDEDISAGRGLAMSFTGKTEEFSDFAMKRMRARLGERASETKGFSSAGLTINPGAHLLYVDVPDEKLDLLIGSRGSTIEELRTRTGCQIDIPKGGYRGETRRVLIIGAGDSPFVAKSMIEILVNGKVADYEVEMNVPKEVIGLIVGNHGSLQCCSRALLQIPAVDHPIGSEIRLVKLQGDPQSVEACRYQIDRAVANAAAGRRITDEIAYLEEELWWLISEAARVKDEIRDRAIFDLRGPMKIYPSEPQFPAAAKAKLGLDIPRVGDALQETMPPRSPDSHVLHVMVPDDKVGLIVGKGGSTIEDLKDRTGGRVQIPSHVDRGTSPPARKVILTGTGDSPYHAKREIEAMLLDDDGRYGGEGNRSGMDGGRGGTGDGKPSPGVLAGEKSNADTGRKGAGSTTEWTASSMPDFYPAILQSVQTHDENMRIDIDENMRRDALIDENMRIDIDENSREVWSSTARR